MLCPFSTMGNHHARESGEEECELFGDMFPGQEETPENPSQHEAHQDELDRASIPLVSNGMSSSLEGPRCVNGELVRPTPRDDAPSTACQASTACAPGGARLGQAKVPCFGSPPGIVPSWGDPPIPEVNPWEILKLEVGEHCSLTCCWRHAFLLWNSRSWTPFDEEHLDRWLGSRHPPSDVHNNLVSDVRDLLRT